VTIKRPLLLCLLTAATLHANNAFADLGTTRFVSFKAYEEFEIKTTDGKAVVLGKGQLSPRPLPRPTADWRQIGRSFGLKENPSLCDSQQIDDILIRTKNSARLITIVSRIEREFRDELLPEEAKELAAMPLCIEISAFLPALARLIPNYPTSSGGSIGNGSGLMVVNTTLSDEGHGWVVLNARLTDGKQAIIHTGHKVKNATNHFEGLIAKGEADITAKISQQPFAVKKILKKRSSEKRALGRTRTRSCSVTEYRTQCTYDPVTKKGTCERVPYTIEGTETTLYTDVDETRVNDFQILSADKQRLLGVITLESKYSGVDIEFGNCSAAAIPADPRFPEPSPVPFPSPLSDDTDEAAPEL
jgi:hypothetical protein